MEPTLDPFAPRASSRQPQGPQPQWPWPPAATTTDNGGRWQRRQDDAAAKGSAKSPLAKPAKLNESPLLADMVKAGSLPAVDDRVGPEPYVIPHNWVKQGKYGGPLG